MSTVLRPVLPVYADVAQYLRDRVAARPLSKR